VEPSLLLGLIRIRALASATIIDINLAIYAYTFLVIL
jgi:hypothetical protein